MADPDRTSTARPLRCRLIGCAWVFDVEDRAVVWRCQRGCGREGWREYESEAEARRFAGRLRRGAPEPPLGLLAALGGGVVRRDDPRRGR